MNTQLDQQDRAILERLQNDSSISNVELSRQVNLSPPAIHSRIKRLEQLGYIQGYTAVLDREQLGYDLLCFIQVRLEAHHPEAIMNFRDCIEKIPEVLECYYLTGNTDYLLKVVVRHKKDLQHFLMEKLTPIRGIARFETSLALEEIKATTILPIDAVSEDED